VLNRCDPATDRIWNGARTRVRSLSGVIAHEATHSLLRSRYGRGAVLRLPRWKEEGICDAVARDSSFPEAEGRALIRSGGDDPSGSFFYLRARLMVEELREAEGRSWDEIVARDDDEGAVLARLRARLGDR